eukprot:1380599-Rhodomonas_salina.2
MEGVGNSAVANALGEEEACMVRLPHSSPLSEESTSPAPGPHDLRKGFELERLLGKAHGGSDIEGSSEETATCQRARMQRK